MAIARAVAEARMFAPSVVAIGNFDGVHTGHQHLLRATVALARKLNASPTVLTFDPHPACIVAPERAPKMLYSIAERCALLAGQGIDQIAVLPFTRELSQWTPEQFAGQLLKDVLHAKGVVVGDNFRFGKQQTGHAGTLEALGVGLGFVTSIVTAVRRRGIIASASEVRRRLDAGDVSGAARLLGRPYALSGAIVHGHGIGSKQAVPTLNLAAEQSVFPANGVYLTRTHDLNGARSWNSITNIGVRPTFQQEPDLSVETFLLSAFDGTAPERIRVEFLRRVREERKFASPEELKAQILRDVGRAQSYFRRTAKWICNSSRSKE